MTMLLLGQMWLVPMAPARAEAALRAETRATCHRGVAGTDTTISLRFLSTSQGAAYVDTINVSSGAFVP
jgi:hypothetical protein